MDRVAVTRARDAVRGTSWELSTGLIRSADRATGHCFTSEELRDLALAPPVRGFSLLEFLGDAVAGVAVWRAGLQLGRPNDELASFLSNDALDERLVEHQLSLGLRSGDVLEALVGAVFRDAGFEPAAAAALRLIAPPLDDAASRRSTGPLSDSQVTVLGAAALSGVFAVISVEEQPDGTAGDLSRRRAELLTVDRIVEFVTRLDPDSVWYPTAGLSSLSVWESVKEVAGTLLLASGWDHCLEAARVLVDP